MASFVRSRAVSRAIIRRIVRQQKARHITLLCCNTPNSTAYGRYDRDMLRLQPHTVEGGYFAETYHSDFEAFQR